MGTFSENVLCYGYMNFSLSVTGNRNKSASGINSIWNHMDISVMYQEQIPVSRHEAFHKHFHSLKLEEAKLFKPIYLNNHPQLYHPIQPHCQLT